MNNVRQFTWIEWLVSATVLMLLVRLIWAHELFVAEAWLFRTLGLDGAKRFLLVVPFGLWWSYRIYARERVRLGRTGAAVLRPKVLVLAGCLLVLAVAILVYSVRG